MVQMISSKKATTDLKEVTGRMSDNLCREAAYLNPTLKRDCAKARSPLASRSAFIEK